MNFIDKYSTFSKGFYLVVLGLTIPLYLLLYGASGHQFNPPAKDIAWIAVIPTAFVTLILYLMLKEKTGFAITLLKVLVALTLLLTTYGGLTAFLWMIQFDYDDEISLIIRGLSYIIPFLFTVSSVIILFGLFNKRGE